MTENILFDNILVTDDIVVADKLADDRCGSWILPLVSNYTLQKKTCVKLFKILRKTMPDAPTVTQSFEYKLSTLLTPWLETLSKMSILFTLWVHLRKICVNLRQILRKISILYTAYTNFFFTVKVLVVMTNLSKFIFSIYSWSLKVTKAGIISGEVFYNLLNTSRIYFNRHEKRLEIEVGY